MYRICIGFDEHYLCSYIHGRLAAFAVAPQITAEISPCWNCVVMIMIDVLFLGKICGWQRTKVRMTQSSRMLVFVFRFWGLRMFGGMDRQEALIQIAENV